jgi:1-deoxy-D-xylulose-5-phosphate synthase
MKPVVAIYSTFLQRGYDQLIHDVAIQNLPVVFALDRAGIVGADGATHNGAFDIAYLRCVPNVAVLTPSDENECRKALSTAFTRDHPVAVRYPRGAGVGAAVEPGLATMPWARGLVRRHSSLAQGTGRRVAMLAFGTVLHPALAAAEALDATVADMRFVKPLDQALVLELAASHDLLVTVEEGMVMGGAGSAVAECLMQAASWRPLLQLGLPDEFLEHGDPARLLALAGLDAAGIEAAVRKRLGPPLALVKPAAQA